MVWHDEVMGIIRVLGYLRGETDEALFRGRILSPAEVLRFQQPDPAHGWWQTLQALSQYPEHAPLYFLIGRVAVILPLVSVVALRGTSALFGILVPVGAFWLMRELFGRGPVPWVAAGLWPARRCICSFRKKRDPILCIHSSSWDPARPFIGPSCPATGAAEIGPGGSTYAW